MAGFRKPSAKKSFSARTTGRINRSVKRATNPFYGKKGTGFIKDPKEVLKILFIIKLQLVDLVPLKVAKQNSQMIYQLMNGLKSSYFLSLSL